MPGQSLLRNVLSQNRDGLVATDYATDLIFAGKAFTVNQVYSVATGADKFFLFDPPADSYIVTLPLHFSATDGPVVVNVSTGSDYTGGTAITPLNRDNRSATAATATLTQDPTGSSLGTNAFSYLLGTSGGLFTAGGGTVADALPFIINPATTYLVQVDNQSGANIQVEVRITWYEL